MILRTGTGGYLLDSVVARRRLTSGINHSVSGTLVAQDVDLSCTEDSGTARLTILVDNSNSIRGYT